MKKGFTLVELLAVIIILAALLLIIIPIVDDTIDKAEEKSNLRWAENYIRAVELAINVDELDVPIGTYDIMKNGDLCIGTYDKSSNKCTGYQLEVEITNAPKSGFVTIENNLAIEYSLTLENDKIVSNIDTNTTNPSCFEYIDNYDYTINEEVCINEFGPLIDELNLGGGLENFACNKETEQKIIDLILLGSYMNYTPTQLESMGVISIEESSKNGNGTVSIKKYTCSEEIKDVIIPRKINNKLVTKIGAMAFLAGDMNEIDETKSINSVIIPSSITIIEGSAFAANNLTNVTIPNNVTEIGFSAFSQNQLTSVEFGDSLTYISDGAFSQNKLTNVIIPNNVTYIGMSAFSENDLTDVTIPNNVRTISPGAFSHNKLTSVTIPNSLTTIPSQAFLGNNLTSITIPDSVITIGSLAFSENDLTDVIIPNSVTTIGERAFLENNITSLMLGNSVQTIGNNAFQANQLTSVTIPDSVQTIGERAFSANQLTSVTIGDSVQTIGNYAFDDGTYTNSNTGITWGPNKLQNVYINRSSSEITLVNSVFGWARGYEGNIHWNSTGPTG